MESNVKDEERLTKHLFRLLRCGRTEDARQLCYEVGQPWRSASLGCGGGLGLIPLGASYVPPVLHRWFAPELDDVVSCLTVSM